MNSSALLKKERKSMQNHTKKTKKTQTTKKELQYSEDHK